MHSRRSAALAALLILAATGSTPAIAAQADDAGRAESTESTGNASRVVVPVPEDSYVIGVVTDDDGNYLDDIEVRAIDENGDIAASALTYACTMEDGPQHGYFSLYVPPGTYDIVALAEGYRRKVLEGVSVKKDQKTEVKNPIVMTAPPVASVLKARAISKHLTVRQHPLVRVKVSAADVKRPLGTVTVRDNGRRLAKQPLTASSRGKSLIALPRLKPGRHVLTIVYSGQRGTVKKSIAKPVILTVARGRR